MAGGGPDCRHTTLKETKEFIRTKLTPIISFDEAFRQVGLPRPGKREGFALGGDAMRKLCVLFWWANLCFVCCWFEQVQAEEAWYR